MNLNNLDKAEALGWGGLFVLFSLSLFFVHLFKSLPGLRFRNSREITSHGLLESICIACLRLQ